MSRTLDLLHVVLPLRRPYRTATTHLEERHVVLVAITEGELTGWGEAAPIASTPETVDDVWEALAVSPPEPVGWPATARAAVEQAEADLEARLAGEPLWRRLGGGHRRVLPVSEAVGMEEDIDHLLSAVDEAVAAGSRAVKLKVAPGWCEAPLREVRRAFPDLAIALDANGSFGPDDRDELSGLARWAPSHLEQPFPAGDLPSHAELRRSSDLRICLDESIGSTDAAVAALRAEAADLLCVKPGRLGIAASLAIHRLAADQGVPIKPSGLLESSVGKSYTIAVGSLPGVDELDLVPAARHFTADVVVDPWEQSGGGIAVRDSPGIGVEVDPLAGGARIERQTRLELVVPQTRPGGG